MEKMELNHKPEIDEKELNKLLSIIDSLKFEDYEEFEFNGQKFLLQILPVSHLKEEEGGAWFAGSTHIKGIDIYIVKEQPIKERKRRMFHEVIEANAKYKGFDQATANQYAAEQEFKFFDQDI